MSNCLPKILITGGGGQLCTALLQHSAAKHVEPVAFTKQQLNISDGENIRAVLDKVQPNLIINTAAYTAVDKAETEKALCTQVNEGGAKQLAVACHAVNIPLLHVSTDYVFDGTQTVPYAESDATTPINWYGQSKWLGEEAIREHCSTHLILRVSGIFSEFGNNFLKTILRLAQEKSELRIVADQVTCPTSASDIATAIWHAVPTLLQRNHLGTYHFCSGQPTSWHQFAAFIVQEAHPFFNLTAKQVTPIMTAEYPTTAKRPAYSVLCNQKILKDYGISAPSWQQSVKEIIRKLC